jgi:hypothetical protein
VVSVTVPNGRILGFLEKSNFLIGPVIRLVPSNEPSKVGVSLRSPEDGNRSSFRNAVFFSI